MEAQVEKKDAFLQNPSGGFDKPSHCKIVARQVARKVVLAEIVLLTLRRPSGGKTGVLRPGRLGLNGPNCTLGASLFDNGIGSWRVNGLLAASFGLENKEAASV